MGNTLSCVSSQRNQYPDKHGYKYKKNFVAEGDGILRSATPDLLPIEATQFARFSRHRSSTPASVTVNNNEAKPFDNFTFEQVFRLSQAQYQSPSNGIHPTSDVMDEGEGQGPCVLQSNVDSCYMNLPSKRVSEPLPPIPDSVLDNVEDAEPIPEEEPTPPMVRRLPPSLPDDQEEVGSSPRLPPRPKNLSLPKASSIANQSFESIITSPFPRKAVDFADKSSCDDHQISLQHLAKGEPTTLSDSAQADMSATNFIKRPKKPPRNYSYKASTLPKRISHTTDEVMELWDAVRKALSLERLHVDKPASDIDEEEDIDEIYQNLYAARMRSWQIMCLAQDILIEKMKPEQIWQYFIDESLITAEEYNLLGIDKLSTRESNQLIIDRILEHGDGHFDRLREKLRSQADLKLISDLIEALNEIFIIGSKANKWMFSLTTKQCSVGYRKQVQTDQPDLIGDTNKQQPTIILEVFNENFGNSSCCALADVLGRYKVISQLNLGKNRITAKGLAKLLRDFENNESLEKLNLRLNPVENDGLEVLVDAVQRNPCLRELILCHTNLQAGCGRSISQLLIENHTLCVLDLSYNEISDGDCRDLQKGFQVNTTLQSVNLRGNQLSARGCDHFCGGLARNTILVNLDLSHNSIGDDGARSIADLLTHNGTLRELHLESCGISSQGCLSMAAAIRDHVSLQCLYLSNNSIGDPGAIELASMLLANKCLQVLYLNLCSITRTGLKYLLDALSKENTVMKTLAACYNHVYLNDDNELDGVSAITLRNLLNLALENGTDRRILTWGKPEVH